MHLKIVLHIKIQFVSCDLMVVNKTHLKKADQERTQLAFLRHLVVSLINCRGEGKLTDLMITT